MSRRLMRISLALVLLLSSEVWAIGLGDINLDSALNEPLRAEIELLSATPDELANLSVALASAETFERYGIDRPFYLQEIGFNVENRTDGAVIVVRSRSPITEPFLTFLVEATWSSGRLLREYTVLLDPPTYAPPAVQQTPAVEAPRRAEPRDSARIERQPPPPPVSEPQPVYTPPSRTAPEPAPAYPSETPYSTAPTGDYVVERGDTLWGIASRMRPDARLTMNQTMLAIFEANPDAFAGNINRLKAGVALTIPSADDVFQISRSDALSEVRRQNENWRSDAGIPDTSFTDTPAVVDEPDVTTGAPDYTTTEPATVETETSLILVPPDEEPTGVDFEDDLDAAEPVTREQEIEARIAELEAADMPDQQSLIEIRDNELATLRRELADLRGEIYEAPVDDEIMIDEEIMADDADVAGEDAAAGADTTADAEPEPAVPTTVVRTRVEEAGIVDRIMDILGSLWVWIVAGAVVLAGVVLWFLRRAGGDDDDRPWETLDSDEIAAGALTATETMHAPTPDDAIVVVEQDSGIRPMDEDTLEAPAPDLADAADTSADAPPATPDDTGPFDSLEDTFSSETAVNLDQTDPLAEADFHMAYGLYDQAADLINGALESDPSDPTLMSKLCEIYFVWGNRDAFIDAATRLRAAVGDGESAEWDKIVIMGQQIASDHELFAGAAVAGATKAVDLSFETDMDESSELDIDFGGDDAGASDIVDLGAAETATGDEGVDFLFEDTADASVEDETIGATVESPTIETDGLVDVDLTAEMPSPAEPTVETPTIEDQFAGLEGTSELPSLDESLGAAISEAGQDSDATAEINLDELDLDVDGLAETELASLDDLEVTGTNEALEDSSDITGKNPEIDPDATGVRELSKTGDGDEAGIGEGVDFDEFGATGTGMRLAPDETGRMPFSDVEAETDTSIDAGLLDATGRTQVLPEDLAVETASDVDARIGDDDATMLAPGYGDEDEEISGDAETMLAPMDDDDEDFDFAKTEALPPEVFTGDAGLDETGEMPVAGTDVDLDLDDLTAALKVSDGGDTVEQLRDDATVEQPRPAVADDTAEIPTMSIGPEDMSEDLHEARTMTEVGTKLDLARAYVDMGDPAGARSILEEVLDEGDESQRQQAQQLLDSLPG